MGCNSPRLAAAVALAAKVLLRAAETGSDAFGRPAEKGSDAFGRPAEDGSDAFGRPAEDGSDAFGRPAEDGSDATGKGADKGSDPLPLDPGHTGGGRIHPFMGANFEELLMAPAMAGVGDAVTGPMLPPMAAQGDSGGPTGASISVINTSHEAASGPGMSDPIFDTDKSTAFSATHPMPPHRRRLGYATTGLRQVLCKWGVYDEELRRLMPLFEHDRL